MFWLLLIVLPRCSSLLRGCRFIEKLGFSFLLVSSPQLVANVLNAYCAVGEEVDRFLETTIHKVISKRYGVDVDRLRRVLAEGAQRPICHGKFSCFLLMVVENPSAFLLDVVNQGVDISIFKIEIFRILILVNMRYLCNSLIIFSCKRINICAAY